MKIGKDSAGGWGVSFGGRGRVFAYVRYSVDRAKPGERRWGRPVRLGSGEQHITTLTLAGWHFRKIVQADRVGAQVERLRADIERGP